MINYIYITYFALAIISFASFELLNRPVINRISILISSIFFGLSFYLYFNNPSDDKSGAVFSLTWWIYFIVIYHLLRIQLKKVNNAEPIMTKGSGYDYKTGRQANFADYIFTLLILIVPPVLSYLTGLIITKASC
jgi:hypothetical protein